MAGTDAHAKVQAAPVQSTPAHSRPAQPTTGPAAGYRKLVGGRWTDGAGAPFPLVTQSLASSGRWCPGRAETMWRRQEQDRAAAQRA